MTSHCLQLLDLGISRPGDRDKQSLFHCVDFIHTLPERDFDLCT